MRDTDLERTIYSHQQAMRPDDGETLFTTFADRVVRHVHDLLDKWKYTGRERDSRANLLSLLLPRIGVARAMPASVLCEKLHVSPRELKQLVHDLRLKHGVQIGASRDGGAGGYYLISNNEESLQSSEPYLHQVVAMFRVLRVLRSDYTVAELLGQVRLELEKEEVGVPTPEVPDGR